MKNLKKKNKKYIIKYLSIDPIFNIYTRRYMEYLIKIKNLKYIYILDFNNIGKLNDEIGYDEVNKKFKNIFKIQKYKWFKNIYIGRLFSGDEIIIATNKNNILNQLKELKDVSHSNGLSFEYIYFENKIENLLEEKLKFLKKNKL